MRKATPTKADNAAVPTPRGRRTLVLVTLLFLLPVVAATTLYYSGWKPEGNSLQHGELLQPARPVGDAELVRADGAPYRLSTLRGKWAYIYFTTLPCTEVCRSNLYKMQQVRLAQGRDVTRVERVIIVAETSAALLSELASQNPGLIALNATRTMHQSLAREFVSSQGTALDVPGRVYLMDPIGNLVMSYAPDADPSGMRKDLVRLLRLSQVG